MEKALLLECVSYLRENDKVSTTAVIVFFEHLPLWQVCDQVLFPHKPREVRVALPSGEMWKLRLREARTCSKEVAWLDFTSSCENAV